MCQVNQSTPNGSPPGQPYGPPPILITLGELHGRAKLPGLEHRCLGICRDTDSELILDL